MNACYTGADTSSGSDERSYDVRTTKAAAGDRPFALDGSDPGTGRRHQGRTQLPDASGYHPGNAAPVSGVAGTAHYPSQAAQNTAPKEAARKPAKVSARYLKLLTELRDAYVNGDEDAITNKSSDLEELRDKEEPVLDDDVDITDAVHKSAPAGLKVFSPRQVALYIVEFAEDFPDPLEKITEAFDDARTLKGKDWDEMRDYVSEQVGWLLGGLDAVAEAKVKKQVSDLLDRVHTLKDADYKAKKDELTQQAKDIAGAVGPADVIRNFMERSIAELLSNPETVSALQARLKKVK